MSTRPGPYGETSETEWHVTDTLGAQGGIAHTDMHGEGMAQTPELAEAEENVATENRKLFFFDEFSKKIRATLGVKASDYAYKEGLFWNFDEAAKRVQVLPRQTWGVFWAKHVIAIEKWIKVGQLDDESIDGRLLDCACYCCILYAAIKMGLVK